MIELDIGDFHIEYKMVNEMIYEVGVYDSYQMDSVQTICTNEEFIRILNNPRIAFYI